MIRLSSACACYGPALLVTAALLLVGGVRAQQPGPSAAVAGEDWSFPFNVVPDGPVPGSPPPL